MCFALYSASRLVTRAYRDDLDDLGITYPQYVALIVLWERERAGAPAPTVADLGRRLHLDSGTLTPLLTRLEAAGLVRRRRCSVDDRVRRVELTSAGRALEGPASTMPARLLCRRPQVDRSQLVALKRHLDAMLHAMLADAPE